MHAQAAPVPGAAHTRNAKLLKWVADVATLTQPDSIYWCDGSPEEYRLDLVFLAMFVGIWVVFRASPIRYLMPLDIVSFAFSILLAFVIRTGVPEYYRLETVAVTTLAVSLLIKVPLAYLFGLYVRDRITRFSSLLLTTALFVAVSSTVLGTVMILLARSLSFVSLPRITLVYDAIATFILVLLARLLVDGLKAADSASENESPIRTFAANWKGWLYGCGAITANGCALAANAAAPSSSGSFTRICV